MAKRIVKTMKCAGSCKKEKPLGQFYKSQSIKNEIFGGYCPYCKKCLSELTYEKGAFDKDKLQFVLKEYLDKPFFNDLFQDVLLCDTKNHLGIYLKRLNLKKQGRTLRWKDGDREDDISLLVDNDKIKEDLSDIEIKQMEDSRDDVINLLKYDPFINESEKDKYRLYNNLINYLDDATLQDSFKIPTVIQIVKIFNQVEKIDIALNEYMNDSENLVANANSINTLITSKKNMLSTILNMAKDNGISVNHSLNKSQGAGTLTGTIKKLNEIGLEEAEINLFDIETCDGIIQVANGSNKSIIEQLMMDENDYTEMIKEQKVLINKFQTKAEKLEEENRKLKITIASLQEKG